MKAIIIVSLTAMALVMITYLAFAEETFTELKLKDKSQVIKASVRVHDINGVL